MDQHGTNAEMLARLSGAHTTRDVVRIALQSIPSICASDGVAVCQLSNGHREVHAEGAAERAAAQYLDLPRGRDPICARMALTCSPTHERQLFGEDEWHAQELFQVVAGPNDIEHYLATPLIGHGELVGALAVVRSPREPAFTACDLTTMAMASMNVSMALAYSLDCEPVAITSMQSLTRREKQIAVYVSRGLDNPEIARQLGISVNTVKKYLKTMFEQLGVSRRAELASLVTMARLL
jgi:DNA-binding CsgD family transcriptional regulator